MFNYFQKQKLFFDGKKIYEIVFNMTCKKYDTNIDNKIYDINKSFNPLIAHC